MKIIAIFGSQGAGKSTAANAIAELPGWTKLSFAGPLYKMLDVIVGQDVRKLDKNEPREELGGKTVRYALQHLGTEFGRNMLGETVWLDHMHRRIEIARKRDFKGVVIDDLRFANEYQFLRDRGAYIVEMSRDERITRQAHASEQDWTFFDRDDCIFNIYSTEDLKTTAVRIASFMEEPTNPKISY